MEFWVPYLGFPIFPTHLGWGGSNYRHFAEVPSMGVAAKLRNSWWHAVASLLYETVPGMVWEISLGKL